MGGRLHDCKDFVYRTLHLFGFGLEVDLVCAAEVREAGSPWLAETGSGIGCGGGVRQLIMLQCCDTAEITRTLN